MLLSLDKLRCRAAKLNKADRITKSLTRMSKPKRWEMSNGSIMHVETQSTMRAADMLNVSSITNVISICYRIIFAMGSVNVIVFTEVSGAPTCTSR